MRPLNYADAQYLADMGGFSYEHRSDGATLICVGAELAELARKLA